jgi:hypothetical protein
MHQSMKDSFTAADKRSAVTLAVADEASPKKLIGRTPPIDMERIMNVKRHFDGATVNDIFAAVLGMTIHSCLKVGNGLGRARL